jgi:hypothetical protein
MSQQHEKREYRTFDHTKGYPKEKNCFYECLKCGDVIPAEPDDAVSCKCRNIGIDQGRFIALDPAKLKFVCLKS